MITGKLHHILSFVNPDIREEDYKVLVNCKARDDHSCHLAKIELRVWKENQKYSKVAQNLSHQNNYPKRDNPKLGTPIFYSI